MKSVSRSNGGARGIKRIDLAYVELASSENAQTLPVGLTNFVSQYGVDWGAMSAAGVLMVIPTLIFVWFAQGLLVKGLVSGAVRG